MVIFNEGDRVRLTCDSTCGGSYPGEFGEKGQTGTVILYDPSDLTYEIEFDDPVPHSLAEDDDWENIWYVKGEEIELETLPELTYDPTQQGDKDDDI